MAMLEWSSSGVFFLKPSGWSNVRKTSSRGHRLPLNLVRLSQEVPPLMTPPYMTCIQAEFSHKCPFKFLYLNIIVDTLISVHLQVSGLFQKTFWFLKKIQPQNLRRLDKTSLDKKLLISKWMAWQPTSLLLEHVLHGLSPLSHFFSPNV